MSSDGNLKHNKHFCPCKQDNLFRTKYYYKQLCHLCKLSDRQRCKKLKETDACFVRFIGDLCEGVLDRHIKLPQSAYNELKPHLDTLIDLCNHNRSLKSKQRLIVNQKGGFLSIILPALASSLFGLVSNYIGKKILK